MSNALRRSMVVLVLLAATGVCLFAAGGTAQAQVPAPPPATNPSTSADYQMFQSAAAREAFPRLGTNYRVIAPSSSDYNAISHTVGVTNKWLWPGDQVGQFNTLYASYGFRRLPTLDYSRQAGVNKVVLFGKAAEGGGRIEVTSASRQYPQGGWTTKPGGMAVIWHPRLNQVSGPSYGRPIAVYARPSSPATTGGRTNPVNAGRTR